MWCVSSHSKRIFRLCYKKTSTTRKKLFIFILTLICSYYLYTSITQPIIYQYKLTQSNGSCVLPDVNPFDSSLKHLLTHPDPISCNGLADFVFLDNGGYLRTNTSAVAKSKLKNINCSYQLFIRKGHSKLELGSKHYLVSPTYINGDVFLVTCEDDSNLKVYERVHYNIDFKRVSTSRQLRNETEDDLSVLILVLDSVSRLAAERHLPKTMRFLESQLGAFVFKGHSMNNEWSTGNALGFMAGKMAWPAEFWDNASLIWDDFSKNGYVTLYSEDYVKHATFKPFNLPPTDHFMQPFYLAIETMDPLSFYINNARMIVEDKLKSFKLQSSSPFCYGNLPRHRHLIEFYRRFIHVYKGKLKFGLSWFNELAHDFSSYLELGDDDFLEFFKWLHNERHLKNTMFILMADHGSRVGAVRNTKIGRMEFKMPLLSIVLPDSFKQLYPHIVDNLNENTELLTSHFDVYETMQDVINRRFNASFTNKGDGVKTIGTSLFRKLSPNRNCWEIGISENYCPCYVTQDVSKNDHISRKIAEFVVQEINMLLKPYSNLCVVYRLSSIEDVQRITPKYREIVVRANSFNSFFQPPVKDDDRYSIVIKTFPGDAIFEALVSKRKGGSFTLIGRITRNSKYGETSDCMEEKYMREMCLCHNKVKRDS